MKHNIRLSVLVNLEEMHCTSRPPLIVEDLIERKTPCEFQKWFDGSGETKIIGENPDSLCSRKLMLNVKTITTHLETNSILLLCGLC